MGGYSSKMERNMKGHDHPHMRPRMLLVPVGVFVLVAHSVVLYYVLPVRVRIPPSPPLYFQQNTAKT
jgi:hypothetical protein